jgi:hypothetical protein
MHANFNVASKTGNDIWRGEEEAIEPFSFPGRACMGTLREATGK